MAEQVLWSIDQLASTRYGVSVRTIHRWRTQEANPFPIPRKRTGQPRWHIDDIVKWESITDLN